jgi:hypothetical protein
MFCAVSAVTHISVFCILKIFTLWLFVILLHATALVRAPCRCDSAPLTTAGPHVLAFTAKNAIKIRPRDEQDHKSLQYVWMIFENTYFTVYKMIA